MSVLRWLFQTQGFKLPYQLGVWTHSEVTWNVVANVMIAFVFLTIAFLICVFRKKSPRTTPVFLNAKVAKWFSVFIGVCGASHAVQAATFSFPVYHLQLAVKMLTALVAWVSVAVMIPVCIQDSQSLEEAEQDRVIKRVERIQDRLLWREEELARILAALDKLPRILDHDDWGSLKNPRLPETNNERKTSGSE